MLNSALPTGNVIINLILYFMSQFMFKQDLAMAYFPDRSKESAGKLLAREITLTPGLLDALRPTGYRPAQKRLSPRQLQILFSSLGEP